MTIRALENERDFWERRYQQQHRVRHAMEDEIAALRTERDCYRDCLERIARQESGLWGRWASATLTAPCRGVSRLLNPPSPLVKQDRSRGEFAANGAFLGAKFAKFRGSRLQGFRGRLRDYGHTGVTGILRSGVTR